MLVSNTNPAQLREMVRGAYSLTAEQPQEKHAFPVGRQFAESIGIRRHARQPAQRGFGCLCGVSNVSLFADLPVGATVLDLGWCGSGTDTLIAARKVGGSGKVIGVDFSTAMLSRARRAVVEAGVANVEIRESEAETAADWAWISFRRRHPPTNTAGDQGQECTR